MHRKVLKISSGCWERFILSSTLGCQACTSLQYYWQNHTHVLWDLQAFINLSNNVYVDVSKVGPTGVSHLSPLHKQEQRHAQNPTIFITRICTRGSSTQSTYHGYTLLKSLICPLKLSGFRYSYNLPVFWWLKENKMSFVSLVKDTLDSSKYLPKLSTSRWVLEISLNDKWSQDHRG